MNWLTIILGMFTGFVAYAIVLIILALIRKHKEKKNNNKIEE